MDAKYLEEIKARTAQELTDDDYHNLKIADIAKIRMDSKRLVAEVEQLTAELNDAHDDHIDDYIRLKSEIATLKRALELACEDLGKMNFNDKSAKESFNAYIKQAQEE